MPHHHKFCAALLALSGAAPSLLAQTYQVVDLGSLIPGGLTAATGINGAGTVCLTSQASGGLRLPLGARVPAAGGPLQSLGITTNGTFSNAVAINDLGHCVGQLDVQAGVGRQIYTGFHNGITWTKLKKMNFDGGIALAINNLDKVAGAGVFALNNGTNGQDITHAAIMTTTTIQDLGTLGGHSSVASAINDAGEVAGMSLRALPGHRAFFWKPGGSMTDLGSLGGEASAAWGINESGHVVGWAHDAANVERAFFIDARGAGAIQSLGTLGTSSHAKDINNTGIIVGDSWVVGKGPHAFVKIANQPMKDLNDLIPPGSGWVLQYATALNDSGVIVGHGQLNGVQRAFKLTPEAPACYADCDADGTTTIDDFICFQTLFALGDPAADCDADGTTSVDDFICFQTLFALGC